MNVSSVSPQELLQTYLISNVNTENGQTQGLMQGPPPGPPPGDMTDISQTGQILSQIRNELGDGENNEIRDFFKSVMNSIKDGSFDAASLAEDAPEALKTFMEEQGIDLEEFLSDFKDEASERMSAKGNGMQGMGPPPPIFSKISSEFGTGENEKIKNYFQSLIDSVKDGTFDTASLAEEAPEALTSFLESQNIDLESFLNNFASRIPG